MIHDLIDHATTDLLPLTTVAGYFAADVAFRKIQKRIVNRTPAPRVWECELNR